MVKIAICDNEQNSIDELALLLADVFRPLGLGHEFDSFLSAASLYRALEGGRRYDLMFLDIGFAEGELDGMEAGHLIRDALQDYATPIVYISWVDRSARQLLPVRPLYFVVKPLSREEVETAVSIYLKFVKVHGGGLNLTHKIFTP